MATTRKTTRKTTAKKDKNKMDIIAGIDLGNGYVKGRVSVNGSTPANVDLPSCIAYVPVGYKWTPSEPTDEYMSELVNHLDCEVKTPIIPEMDKRRILVGDRAAAISTSLVQFDIEDRNTPKCSDPLSTQLILATIGSEALRAYWDANGALPESSLQVNVDLGVALPFTDYVAYKDQYRDQLEGHTHTIQILNFEVPITVNVSIDSVSILAEGEAALYTLNELGADFLDKALEVAKEDGLDAGDIDGEYLIAANNVVGIDVGAGTVNYAVFRGQGDSGAKIEPGASSSINHGVGTALQRVVEATRSTPYELTSRKDLEKLLLKEELTPVQQSLAERLNPLVSDEMDTLAREIVSEYTRIISPIKLDVEVVYVFGGGANLVKDALYERLLKASEFAGSTLPVILLGSEFSRNMNRNGLYMIAELAHANK